MWINRLGKATISIHKKAWEASAVYNFGVMEFGQDWKNPPNITARKNESVWWIHQVHYFGNEIQLSSLYTYTRRIECHFQRQAGYHGIGVTSILKVPTRCLFFSLLKLSIFLGRSLYWDLSPRGLWCTTVLVLFHSSFYL